ncbi:alpha/beta hydrolase [Thermoleophilia bacterium SCSIO 60948]|nr:alpha/beta hydrolase [Thermoleophilia bacterium SCSIO 60948]
MTEPIFEAFEERRITVPRGEINVRVGGSGPPLLLLHGWPQTHLMWHAVAAGLSDRFTIVAADLPGYGNSFRPEPTDDHAPHSKRAMASDLIAAMAVLGYGRFALAGHDRGGRVAYRMALDRPDAVSALAVLDIVPTGEVWNRADATFAVGYWHWGFLAQAAPLPERLIAADREMFWVAVERMGLGRDAGRYPEEVLEAYRTALEDPAVVEAMCEDYRAGASIDRELDDAAASEGRRIECPSLALWGSRGALPLFYEDPLEPWRRFAPDIEGRAIEATHFLAEDRPDEVAAALAAHFDRPARSNVPD